MTRPTAQTDAGGHAPRAGAIDGPTKSQRATTKKEKQSRIVARKKKRKRRRSKRKWKEKRNATKGGPTSNPSEELSGALSGAGHWRRRIDQWARARGPTGKSFPPRSVMAITVSGERPSWSPHATAPPQDRRSSSTVGAAVVLALGFSFVSFRRLSQRRPIDHAPIRRRSHTHTHPASIHQHTHAPLGGAVASQRFSGRFVFVFRREPSDDSADDDPPRRPCRQRWRPPAGLLLRLN